MTPKPSTSPEASRACRHAGCRARPRATGWCWAHDPELAAKKAAAHRKGGEARRYADSKPDPNAPLASVSDVLDGLRLTVAATWRQKNSAQRSRALISGYATALHVFEVGELEQRLAAVEALVAQKVIGHA